MQRHTLHRLDPAIGLVGALLVINLLAVAGLASSRRDVRRAIGEQRTLEVRTDARTFEALLVQQHAAITFLASSPPIADLAASSAAGDDPVVRRWARLDLEASLLLFMESSPAVRRLEAAWDGLGLEAVAERRDGALQLAPPESPPPEAQDLLTAEWSLDSGQGRLRAWIDPRPLLATTGPGLRLHRRPPEKSLGALEAVASELWTPRLDGWIERAGGDSSVERTVERLASRYGWTLFANVALIPLSLLLAGLTLRRERRLARLESEAAQRARMEALERQVRHAERLASLGRFAAGIAHEINNPLGGMSNYLQLLREDLDAGAYESASQWLPRLEEGVERAAGTVRQVLSFAEPGRGEKRPTDLSEIVERGISFLRAHPDCQGIDLRARTESPLHLVGDPQTLGQLVLNLVLNACQASPARGVVEARALRRRDGVQLEVLDRGPGFPAAVLDHLFEPFQSTRGSLGLGLAVCHGIAVDHGGRITVSNRSGGGSRVRVSLPLDPPEAR